jgi:DNA-binding FadR family transcriptional regulator
MVGIGVSQRRPEEPAGDREAKDSGLPSTSGFGSTGIAARLREAILEGHYAYGERLPAERELSVHFGASRGTIREALRRLEETGLVSRRIGSGTFVSHRAGTHDDDIAEITSPIELIEVRLALEPDMARLGVANATARDLDAMEEALVHCESAGADREAFSRADEAFHRALAECTRNPLMIWLYGKINDVRGHMQWTAMKDKILSARRIAEYNVEHRALYEALRSRDVDAAVAAIEKHLNEARIDLLGASNKF